MAGRKPTPTHIKLLRGNPGKRALPTDEPKPQSGVPRCPSYFTKEARKAWRELGKRLDELGVLTLADGPALELLVDAYMEWRDARAVIVDEGETYESHTQNGKIIRARPEVAMASDAWRRVASQLREFGLTPSSRTKVSTTSPATVDNPFAALASQAVGT